MSAHYATPEPGAWGPSVTGGRPRSTGRRLLVLTAALLGVAIVGGGITAALLYRTAESHLTRTPVAALDELQPGRPINLLVVGSDSREGLTRDERNELKLGSFGGQRSDTVILVSVTPDRQGVNMVHFPRDLYVLDEGVPRKLTETFYGGPNKLVEIVQENFGIPVHHYVEVSVPGFLEVVRTIGEVRVCLDEPLVDPKSGADLPAGCQRLSPEEGLAYVRSRQGARGDFERIERQQAFIKAMLAELVETRLLVDLPRLFSVVGEVAGTVRTDEGLTPNNMRAFAQELGGLASGEVPMTVVPGYTRTIDGKSFVLPYRPGATALFSTIREGEVVEVRGTPEQRSEVELQMWTGGRARAAAVVESTLNWSGFRARPAGSGPVDAGAVTTIYAAPGAEFEAGIVAATLGAPIGTLPADVSFPEGVDVVVAVGDDAAPS